MKVWKYPEELITVSLVVCEIIIRAEPTMKNNVIRTYLVHLDCEGCLSIVPRFPKTTLEFPDFFF